MAPALKVSHLMAISLTDVAPSLRIVRLPTGPTFSFRIERYSLNKDLLRTSRPSRSQGLEYVTAPLVRRHISLHIYSSFLIGRIACARLFSSALSEYTSTFTPFNEGIPVHVSPPCTKFDVSLRSASYRPHRIQRRTRYHRLSPLLDHRQTLRCFQTRSAGPRGG